jgi:hypothetical protein
MSKYQTINSSAELDYPKVLPTLDLNFMQETALDPRITFSRSSGGTYVGPDGLIKIAGVNQPRFQYNPLTGECLGLLIEESRTNLVYPSEPSSSTPRNSFLGNTEGTGVYYAFDSSTTSSSKNGITGLNVNISPSIDNNSYNGGFATNWGGIAGGIGAVGASVSFTGPATGGYISFFINPMSWKNNIYCGFLPSGNTTFISQTSNTLIFNNGLYVGNSGWIVRQIFSDGTYWLSRVVNNDIGTFVQGGNAFCLFTTNPGNNSDFWWFGGVQYEIGAFSTSYIQTTTATITRNADSASITGTNFSSWFNSNVGTFYVHAVSEILNYYKRGLVYNSPGWTPIALGTGAPSAGRVLQIEQDVLSNNTTNVTLFMYNGGGTNYGPNLQNLISVNQNTDKVVFYVDYLNRDYGVGSANKIFRTLKKDPSYSTFTGDLSYNLANMMQIGYNSGYRAAFSGIVKQITYWPRKLPSDRDLTRFLE